MRQSFLAAALVLAAGSQELLARSIELGRSASMGIALEASSDWRGAQVRLPNRGVTGAALGSQQGDVTLSLNNQPVADVPTLIAVARCCAVGPTTTSRCALRQNPASGETLREVMGWNGGAPTSRLHVLGISARVQRRISDFR